MHRTNIYLTDGRERALDERAPGRHHPQCRGARDHDRDLGAPPAIHPEVAAGFAELADLYDEITEGMFDDGPDLRIER